MMRGNKQGRERAMPHSLRAYLSKARYEGHITDEQYKKYIRTLDRYKALEQQPCEDAISRDAVIEGIEELKRIPWVLSTRSRGYEYLITETLDVVKDLCVKQLPSVTRQTGEWISRETDGQRFPFWGRYKCSVCGECSGNTDFCPNCGADMRGESK